MIMGGDLLIHDGITQASDYGAERLTTYDYITGCTWKYMCIIAH